MAAALLLHVGFFYALQAGLFHRTAAKPGSREIIAVLIPAEQPKPQPKIEPPKPLPSSRSIPRPAAPQPVAVSPDTPPSDKAITLPSESETAPVAAPPAPAPVAIEPMPVIPPRFDAAYLNNPAPPYPSLARRMGQQGKVLLRVHVSAQGLAEDVQLKTSCGHPRLDEIALDTVKQWRFVPAQQAGQSVDAWVLVPLVFRLDS